MVELRPNFLPESLLYPLAERFERAPDWKDNVAPTPYGNPGSPEAPPGDDMPRVGEIYKTEFAHSQSLQNDELVRKVVGLAGGSHHVCYRMGSGQGLRIHSDDYFGGERSATLYLSRRWVWDWGGLLHVVEGGKSTPVCPRLNLLAVMGHLPHFVSTVERWALCPRYSISIFGMGA